MNGTNNNPLAEALTEFLEPIVKEAVKEAMHSLQSEDRLLDAAESRPIDRFEDSQV